MFELSLYNLAIFLIAIVAAVYIWRRTALRAAIIFNVHHKTAILALVIYFLLVWGVQYFALTYFPQPRGWLTDGVVFAEDAARNVWEVAPHRVNDTGTVIGSGIASVVEQLVAAISEMAPTIVSVPTAPEAGTPAPASEAYCVTTIADGQTSVYLRRLPDWNETADRGNPDYRVAPDTIVKIYSKLICLDAAGDSETWFEVRGVDGGRRVVNEIRCRLAAVDVSALPDINWQSVDGTNRCTSYQ